MVLSQYLRSSAKLLPSLVMCVLLPTGDISSSVVLPPLGHTVRAHEGSPSSYEATAPLLAAGEFQQVPTSCGITPAQVAYLPSALVKTYVYAKTSGNCSRSRARVTVALYENGKLLEARSCITARAGAGCAVSTSQFRVRAGARYTKAEGVGALSALP